MVESMRLKTKERNRVKNQMRNFNCPQCGDKLVIHDDGCTAKTSWGVSGAYVVCDSCGLSDIDDALKNHVERMKS